MHIFHQNNPSNTLQQQNFIMFNFSISLLILSSFLFTCTRVCVADNHNLQDTCPSAPHSSNDPVFINGLPCKNPANATSADFMNSMLSQASDTDNFLGSSVSLVTAAEFPGLNTLGLSIARTDLEVDGLVSPHSHPRASEILFVSEGIVIVGFMDTKNNGFQKVLRKGDVFVVPRGLLHYCFNAGFEAASIFSVLNSQNPGVVSISDVVFGSDQEAAKILTMRLASVHKVDSAYEDDHEVFTNFNSLEAATKMI